MNDEEKSREQLLEEITQLREDYQCYKFLFDNAPLGCISIDKNGIILIANKTFLEYLNYSQEELIGNNLDKFISPKFLEDFRNYYDNFVEKGISNNIEFEMLRKDGSVFDCHLRSNPLVLSNPGNGSIITIMDIKDRKKAQTQLEENIHYIAFLIDNIRNPLSIISGYAELKIEDEKMNKKILNQIDKIEDLMEGLDKGWIDSEDTKEFLKNFM